MIGWRQTGERASGLNPLTQASGLPLARAQHRVGWHDRRPGGLPLLRDSTTLALDVPDGAYPAGSGPPCGSDADVAFYPGYEMFLEPATEQVVVV